MKCFMKLFISCSLFFGASCFALQNETVTQSSSPSEQEHICSETECYTVLKKLGAGAFGEVFAVENSNGEQFALKTFKNFEDSNLATHVLADSKREFSVGQLLEHPNIIKSYDLFSSETCTGKIQKNLVLQLVKGQVLFDVEKGTLSKSDAMNAAITLCNALKYADTQGLMHFDLHTNNLMLNEKLEVMVIDLASFLTVEEVFKMWKIFENSSSITNSTSQSRSLKTLRGSEEDDILKPEQIFAMKPKLFELMQQVKMKIDQHESQDKATSSDPILHNFKKRGIVEDFRDIFCLINFNAISESCVDIVKKTDLSRDEKFELRAQIKKIYWHYEEDLDEKVSHPIEHYIDRLIMFLQTQL